MRAVRSIVVVAASCRARSMKTSPARLHHAPEERHLRELALREEDGHLGDREEQRDHVHVALVVRDEHRGRSLLVVREPLDRDLDLPQLREHAGPAQRVPLEIRTALPRRLPSEREGRGRARPRIRRHGSTDLTRSHARSLPERVTRSGAGRAVRSWPSGSSFDRRASGYPRGMCTRRLALALVLTPLLACDGTLSSSDGSDAGAGSDAASPIDASVPPGLDAPMGPTPDAFTPPMGACGDHHVRRQPALRRGQRRVRVSAWLRRLRLVVHGGPCGRSEHADHRRRVRHLGRGAPHHRERRVDDGRHGVRRRLDASRRDRRHAPTHHRLPRDGRPGPRRRHPRSRRAAAGLRGDDVPQRQPLSLTADGLALLHRRRRGGRRQLEPRARDLHERRHDRPLRRRPSRRLARSPPLGAQRTARPRGHRLRGQRGLSLRVRLVRLDVAHVDLMAAPRPCARGPRRARGGRSSPPGRASRWPPSPWCACATAWM
jgi:hypothetical protein